MCKVYSLNVGVFIGFMLFIPVSLFAQKDNPFRALARENQSRQFRRTFLTSDTISLDGMGTIYALSIDATIQQPREASFTRIVLEDTEGHDYLVAESNWFRNDTTEVHLDHFCEETALLEGITPLRLKCYLAEEASLTLSGIHTSSQRLMQKNSVREKSSAQIKEAQVQKIVDRINEYNQKHGKLWRAGVTPRSLLNYMSNKDFSGEIDAYMGSLQFYEDGIYQIGDHDEATNIHRVNATPSLYVPHFDWRHRHGRNMMTSVKHQGNSGYCTAFAINGMLEARANLYFNQKVDFDLSEQDIVYNYARAGYQILDSIYVKGMNIYTALNDVVNNGVLDEEAVPFIDQMLHNIPPRPNGNECIQITSHLSQGVSDSFASIENLKQLLITHGPVVSSFGDYSSWHAVTMVGYHVIQAGDTISQVIIPSEGGLFSPIIVPDNSPFIGDTYWVMKDSYGLSDSGRHEGYMYIWFKTYSRMGSANYTTSPIISRNYSDSDIICEDRDGDGYFNWGIGQKPAHCPAWAPDEADGDDSDATLGPMNTYGFIEPLQTDSTIYVDVNTQYPSGLLHISNNICIRNSSTLTISSDLLMNRLAEIRIKPGATLIVNGTIRNANIRPEPGSTLILNNGGRIITHSKDEFNLPVGAKLEINEGSIK